jgi:hypothetical protein
MNGWEKSKIIGGLLATVLIPLAVAFIGQAYAQAIKDREIRAKYVEIAIDILRTPPSDDRYDVRAWAADVIVSYSGVKLTDEQKETLIRSNVLPQLARPTAPPPASETAPAPPPTPIGDGEQQTHEVTVPNVRGLSVKQAREAFQAAGLKFTAGTDQTDHELVNTQDPLAGARVPAETEASIVIGKPDIIPPSRRRLER